MTISQLTVFAQNGEKNTTGLTQLDGFPPTQKPARQWFNWLFNAIAVKINEIIQNKADKNGNSSNRFKVANAVDNDDAVSKSQLPAQATNVIVGISREATSAEVLAGALAGVFISPLNLGAAFTATTSSTQMSMSLPNGYTIKMGYTIYGELPSTVVSVPTTFTTAFSGDALFGFAAPYNPSLSGQMAFLATTRSWTDTTLNVDMVELSGSGNQFDAGYVWFVIGTEA